MSSFLILFKNMNKKTASMFLFIFRISWILHSVHFNFAPPGFFSIFSRNYSVFPRKWNCRWWGVVVSVNGDERNGGGVNKARKVSSGDSNLHCCFSCHSVNFCLFSCSTGNLQIWKGMLCSSENVGKKINLSFICIFNFVQTHIINFA